MSAPVDAQCFLRLKPDRRARSRTHSLHPECSSDRLNVDPCLAVFRDRTERNGSESDERNSSAYVRDTDAKTRRDR